MQLDEGYGYLKPVVFGGQLPTLARTGGTYATELHLPAMWSQSVIVEFRQLVIWFQTTPLNQHAFEFRLNDSTDLGTVTATTTGNFWRTNSNFSMKGQTDYLNIIHHADGTEGEMAGAHVDEGGRIFAFVVPAGT